MKVCSVDGCERKHEAKGLCKAHYAAQWKRENPQRRYDRKVQVPCSHCGAVVTKYAQSVSKRKPYCDYVCRDLARTDRRGVSESIPREHPVMRLIYEATYEARKSALRVAVESGDYPVIVQMLSERTITTQSGCWQWTGRSNDGYPVVIIAKRHIGAHRLMLEASLGRQLGAEAAHHKCANRLCIRPEHLQPVTARENIAEMLARRALEARIADLEEALAALAPAHPALAGRAAAS